MSTRPSFVTSWGSFTPGSTSRGPATARAARRYRADLEAIMRKRQARARDLQEGAPRPMTLPRGDGGAVLIEHAPEAPEAWRVAQIRGGRASDVAQSGNLLGQRRQRRRRSRWRPARRVGISRLPLKSRNRRACPRQRQRPKRLRRKLRRCPRSGARSRAGLTGARGRSRRRRRSSIRRSARMTRLKPRSRPRRAGARTTTSISPRRRPSPRDRTSRERSRSTSRCGPRRPLRRHREPGEVRDEKGKSWSRCVPASNALGCPGSRAPRALPTPS